MKKIAIIAFAASALSAFLFGPFSGSGKMNVVLITSDTTRAQSVPSYGNPVSRMPNLDRLIRGGTQIRWGISVSSCTMPSHISMLTGLYPDRHGVTDNTPGEIPEFPSTLTEILNEEGYDTTCYCGTAILSSTAKHFKHQDLTTVHYNQPALYQRNSAEYLDVACRFLREHRGKKKPFFMWFHSFDPHHPYSPPEPYTDLFEEVAQGEPFIDYNDPENVPIGYDPDYPPCSTLAQYYGELASWDKNLGKLMDEISEIPNTLVIFVADHGENLGEDGIWNHVIGNEHILRIPMVFYHDDESVVPAGRILDTTGQQCDILPTVMSLLGLPINRRIVDGSDLSEAIRGERAPAKRLAFTLSGCWAYMSDPVSELKYRRGLTGIRREDLGVRDYSELRHQFIDNIIDDGILEFEEHEGNYLVRYFGKVLTPEVSKIESIDLEFHAGNMEISYGEIPVYNDGRFAFQLEEKRWHGLDFWKLTGEETHPQESYLGSALYALRFLDGNGRLLWESPWISYKRSIFRETGRDSTNRLIDISQHRGVEVGIPALDNPRAERLIRAMDCLMNRAGGLYNPQGTFIAPDGTIWASAKGDLLSPREAFKLGKESKLLLAQRSPEVMETRRRNEEDMTEALRSLGYIN